MNTLTTKFSKPVPSIEFIFPDGCSHTMSILSLCHGLTKDGKRPHAFRFIDCDSLVVTEEFIDWYFDMVLPCLSTNPFMYRFSIATAPQELQAILKLPQEVEYV